MRPEEKLQLLEQQLQQLSESLKYSQLQLQVLEQELYSLRRQQELPVKPLPEQPQHNEQQHGVEHFIGLKLIHLVGIIVLVTGLSIGVKYAIDGQLISETMRIVLAYAAGAVLFFLSLRLKKKYVLFSAILFSGSMASIYFTTYACFSYYQFISAGVAFAIMVALTVYTIIMALQYDRREIAIIGMVGAYGIPFLVSANNDRFELLFSYILLINAGTIYLSFRKIWKIVGQLAMVITWTLVIGWAFMRANPSDDQWMGFLFALVFYLLFCVNAISFLLIRRQQLSGVEVQQLLLNQAAFFLASLCLFDIVWVSGLFAVWTGVFVLVVTLFFPQERWLQRLLSIEALILILLWITLRWDGLFVTLLWVAVAVILFAWGIAGRRSWIRLTAVFLVGITLGKLLIIDSARFTPVQKIICYIAIGVLLLLFSFYYQRLGLAMKKEKEERQLQQDL